MPANGLKSMLGTFQRVLEGKAEMDPDAVNTLMLGGIVAVLTEVQGIGEKIDEHGKKLDGQARRITKLDRRLIAVGIIAALALAAIGAHTGWTWLSAAAAVP